MNNHEWTMLATDLNNALGWAIRRHDEYLRDCMSQAAAALGYRLVAIEPEPVTDKPGFDGRDGGRMHEQSSAQEA